MQAEMAESEAMQSIVKQANVQAATAVMMVIRDAGVKLRPATNTESMRKSHRKRHSRSALETFP